MVSNYDTPNTYDSINEYDTGGAVVMAEGYMGWLAVLNELRKASPDGELAAAFKAGELLARRGLYYTLYRLQYA